MNKFAFLSLLFLPLTLYAKSYEITMSPCDLGTNCKKCYEVVRVTYTINTKSKQVIASGKDIDGKIVKEPIEKCQIADVNNWICDSTYLVTQAKNGVIALTNKPDTNMTRSKKEVCLTK
jgi:hypothetical protein